MTDHAKPKLFVATPAFGGMVTSRFARSLLELRTLTTALGWEMMLWFGIGESLIQRARNEYVAAFLQTDCTHLLSIDADIGFDCRAVPAMVSSGHDMVCCTYPRKVVNWDGIRRAATLEEPDLSEWGTCYAFNFDKASATPDELGLTWKPERGCVPVQDAATGFLLTTRKAIVDMVHAYPETLYLSNHDQSRGEVRFALFECEIEPGTRLYLSEDFLFSRRWQRMGGKVWMYVGPHCDLVHVGSYDYRGSVHRYMQPVGPESVATESSLPEESGAYGIAMRERYEWAAQVLRGSARIADACSGPGYGMPYLARAGAQVVGFDRDPKNAETCAAKGFGELRLVDTLETETLDGFDALCTLETVEHLQDPIGWLRRLSPSVRRLVLSCPSVPTKHRNQWHKHDFAYGEVLRIVQALGWTTKEHRKQNGDTIWLYAERGAA